LELFDHFVGAFKQWPRHHQTERLRGLEIDHQLILGRRLHRGIARLLAFEHTINIAGRAANLVIENWLV
jgi:hypothetical protein